MDASFSKSGLADSPMPMELDEDDGDQIDMDEGAPGTSSGAAGESGGSAAAGA